MKTLKMIDKILRGLVYAMYAVKITMFILFLFVDFSDSNSSPIITSIENCTTKLFLIFMFTLYCFIKNKRSKFRYNLLLLFSGILIFFWKYYYWNTREIYVPGPFINTVFSGNSLLDLVPLSLIYLSTICTYLVSRKKNMELTQG
ncbi:hypothetical protein rsdtw13_34720 [Clostridium sp. TW13]|uniref:Uncharacterized protein n=1 Tax=Inconstantimicrobium mannanitabidum TaxID=1604901 RepID=A0ACB5RGN3_9CLOT|nr:hypothetical protein rsdtw13_34720 [Clostridium sp. TW13]